MAFLLEGKSFEDANIKPGAVQAVDGHASEAVLQFAPAEPKYIGETADYGLKLLTVKMADSPIGEQSTYIVEHKKHKVIGYQGNVLASSILAMQEIQRLLDEALGKDKVKQ